MEPLWSPFGASFSNSSTVSNGTVGAAEVGVAHQEPPPGPPEPPPGPPEPPPGPPKPTRKLVSAFGRSLVQMDPTGLPGLFKLLRTFKNKQGGQKYIKN